VFGLFKKKPPPPEPPKRFPPVPDWQPDAAQPLDRIVDRVRYYSNGAKDFVLFKHGTVVILEDGLDDDQAKVVAKDVLHRIFHAHPDMNPTDMDDGNVLVRYNEPAANVVLSDVAQQHWAEINARHLDGLATDEVLMTGLGANQFDDLGKKALFGRCFMFMDAQNPEISRLVRKDA
jgi:hypothetical protein